MIMQKNKKNLVEIVHLPSVPYLQLEMNTCCHAYILLIITVNGHIVTLELRPKSPLMDPVQSNDSGNVVQYNRIYHFRIYHLIYNSFIFNQNSNC